MNSLPPLIEDRLDRVLTNPTSAPAWHRLVAAWLSVPDPNARTEVVDRLIMGIPDDPIPDFLRATFLFSMTRDTRFLVKASQAVKRIIPNDPDRLGAFLVYAFAGLLAQSDSRESYLNLLRMAAFPDIAARLSQQPMNDTASVLTARPVETIRRVALIAPELVNLNHAPTTLALQHARLLAEKGLAVRVFCAQDMRVADMQFFLGGGEQSILASPDRASWSSILPNSVTVHVSNSQFSLKARWKDTLARIDTFDPDLVFLVGFSSPLANILFKARPVLGLSINTLPPVASLDLWLCANERKAGALDDTWSPWFAAAEAWHYPYRIMLKPALNTVSREQIGLRPGTVAMISVGDRLDREIQPAWASRMLEFMARHPTVEWVIVGGNGQIPPALAAANRSNLHLIPHQQDVRSYCQSCDIFVNPPRMGGGFSVANAMADGLPVLAYAGSDGGDKLGALAVANDTDYFALLSEWVASAAARQLAGAALRQRFDRILDLHQAGAPLIEACEQAVTRFNKRIRQATS